jgi:hypothetical protein
MRKGTGLTFTEQDVELIRQHLLHELLHDLQVTNKDAIGACILAALQEVRTAARPPQRFREMSLSTVGRCSVGGGGLGGG